MPEVVTVPTSTRVPWNRGGIVGPKPPLKPKHIWALRTRLVPGSGSARWRRVG